MGHVYCSGPLFCPEELAGMSAIAGVLERAGYGTFLPQRDGLERYLLPYVDSALNTQRFGLRRRIDRAVFALDVFQLAHRCEALVCNLNGRVPDEGAAVEAGIAFAVGTPVVLYKNDRRSVFHGADNSMLLGLSALAPVTSLEALPAALARVSSPREKKAERPLPPSLAAAIDEGAKLWRLLCLRGERPAEPPDDALARELLAAIEASGPAQA